jgi:hypothetical protein
MQLTIDLTNQPATYGKRVIAMIETFYGLDRSETNSTHTVTIKADVSEAVGSLETLAKAAAITIPPAPAAPAEPTSAAASVETGSAAQAALSSTPDASRQPTVDKTGLPWDARIHSSSKALNADGTWRKRKGLNDDGLVKRIEDELRAAMAIPLAPSAAEVFSTPAALPADVGAAPLVPPPPAVAPPATVVALAPSSIPVPPTAGTMPVADPTTLPELMPRVTEKMIAGLIPNDALIKAVNAVGIPDLPTLAHRPDLVQMVWVTLKTNHPGVWA